MRDVEGDRQALEETENDIKKEGRDSEREKESERERERGWEK